MTAGINFNNNTTNLNNASPTGQVNIESGLGNVFPLACANNQQINVGDIIVQNNDATFGWIGLPAVCIFSNATTGFNNAGNNNNAIHSLQQAVHNNLAGVSVGYRSPKNTSYGKNSDRIGVAPLARLKLPVDTNLNNADSAFNSTAAQPVGTPWGVSCNIAGNQSAVINPNLFVVCGNVGNFTGAEYCIGRQSVPKAAGDAFVYVDLVSTLVNSGAVETATT